MTCFVIVLVDEAGGVAAVIGSATPSPSSQHEQQSSKSGASDGTAASAAAAASSRGAENGSGPLTMSLKSVAQRMAASPSPSFPLAVLVLLGPLLLSYFIEG